MSIKVAVLQSGDQIIADMKEIVSEERPIAYLFNKPHLYHIQIYCLYKYCSLL